MVVWPRSHGRMAVAVSLTGRAKTQLKSDQNAQPEEVPITASRGRIAQATLDPRRALLPRAVGSKDHGAALVQ